MTRQELETQCMALSHVVDTEVVERDPKRIQSFDFGTLYVWMAQPHYTSEGDTYTDDNVSPKLFGRLGPRDETGNSVAELATKLGFDLH